MLGVLVAKLMMSRSRKHCMRRGRLYPLLSTFRDSILFNSIPFVRFDGQMSAKRRRDAIDKFSVPLEPEQSVPQKTKTPDNPYDFDPMVSDDDDFIDEEDEQAFDKKSKRKGKGKAKESRRGSSNEGENPRVMLLSLKAVCCPQIIKKIDHIYINTRVLLG